MEYVCPGIGPVRLTVGQKGGDGVVCLYLYVDVSGRAEDLSSPSGRSR